MAFDTSKISPLGFGCMRWEGRETDNVDLDSVAKMIDAYIAAGGNYFDTAWAYPNSEKTLGEVLVKRYPRDSFYIASKCVCWTHCKSEDDLERQLQESLAALGVDCLDVYLMHNLGGTRTASFEKFNCWEFMKSVKERGLAKHIGFSAHCTPEELRGFIEQYPEAELVQLQVNYADWESPFFQERACVEIAHEAGLPIVVMEPVKGGLLAEPPAAVREVLDAGMPDDSYATAALRFAASAPGVFTTLSGMNTLEQVLDNSRRFEHFEPLSASEHAVIDKAREAMNASSMVPCTSCDYCAKVCPQDIGISRALSVLNQYIAYGDATKAKFQLGFVVRFNGGKNMPSKCIKCGACEAACPQNINIVDCLERIQEEIVEVGGAGPILMRPKENVD